MTASSFPSSLAFVLDREGGFSDNPNDPGGPTNKGVTLKTLQSFYPGSTVQDLQNITDAQLQTVYGATWGYVSGDALPAGVDMMTFDFGVNAGSHRAILTLQDALGVAADGIIGPGTEGALARADPATVVAAYADARVAYYKSLPTFAEFGRGWLARVDACEDQAVALIGKAA